MASSVSRLQPLFLQLLHHCWRHEQGEDEGCSYSALHSISHHIGSPEGSVAMVYICWQQGRLHLAALPAPAALLLQSVHLCIEGLGRKHLSPLPASQQTKYSSSAYSCLTEHSIVQARCCLPAC